jgi:acetyl-CoA acetyltransferase
MSLHTEAGLGALDDAGLAVADVDGLLCAYSFTEPHLMLASVFAEYVGMQPAYASAVSMGGVTACMLVMQAAALVEAGYCRHVLAEVGNQQYEQPYGMTIPAAYALVAQRYMSEFGVTSEQLAAIAVTHREHAALNPKAHMRKPITVDDVMNSRFIATPLHLLDCCLISDGGAAVVVSAADAAADLGQPRIDVLGTGQGHTHEYIVAAPSLTEYGCKRSAADALGRAGLKPSDIDVVEIYDSFTITLLAELESMGFFERGEAGVAAAAGDLKIGGKLPCNTHGGLLSYGHSGAAGGMFHVVEAVEQLRGAASGRQVEGAELALVHGDGGILSAHCSVVLGRA